MDKKNISKYFYIGLISLFLFLVLFVLVSVKNQTIESINKYFFNAIVSNPPTIDLFWRGITSIGSVAFVSFMTLVVTAYLYTKKDVDDALRYILSIGFGGMFVYVIKILSGSKRPEYIYAIESTNSFPSGHTAMITVFSILTVFVFTRGRSKKTKTFSTMAAMVLVFVVGYSRLKLGEHWFFDVVGGFIFGIVVSSLAILIHKTKKLT